jgi:hypothetical protein
MKPKIITMMIIILILVIAVLATVPVSAKPVGNFCPSSGTVLISHSVQNDRTFVRCFDNSVQLWRITCMKSEVLQTPVQGGVLVSCAK